MEHLKTSALHWVPIEYLTRAGPVYKAAPVFNSPVMGPGPVRYLYAREGSCSSLDLPSPNPKPFTFSLSLSLSLSVTMGKSKTPKDDSTTEDLATLQSDVVSFASSLGLIAGAPSSGFDDSDFRKPPKLVKPPKGSNPKPATKSSDGNAKPKPKTPDPKAPRRDKPKPFDVSPFQSNSDGAHKGAELPLMKPSILSGILLVLPFY